MSGWKQKVAKLQEETHALYLAGRDPRTPLHAKVLAGCVVAYTLSPVDLIPDFVPVLGLLDDLVLVPLGILLVLRMIPAEVLSESREKAREASEAGGGPSGRAAAVIILCVWALAVLVLAVLAYRLVRT